ncbi:uncharacterized protein CELE_Y51A2B.6 [Caenorhabditis elegans]|uniref:Domain of unknown function WSN domain-containing protein n=1 Tax=Caenorhabditis elegans TaxID=6239 RepID=O45958_CAEEL|nr:protein of unknown function WSN domain-containing protein [Caenorhabditis elegans]CAA16394.3 Domain of unknown function WSN domain-containing protein [Caenorhabditis elegans]|eukprot:NP_001024257.2 Uncharacterized protein CELE_Y51A2B.6 [Caenorhabditis elegans]
MTILGSIPIIFENHFQIMRFLSAFALALQIKYLTAGNYTFEPDVLLSPPAPFFSFKYIDRISTINEIAKGIDIQADLMNGKVGEILNVTSSDMVNFGFDKIVELTDHLKDISMKSSKEVIGLESDALKYDTFIHNLESVSDSFKFPGKDEYYVEVENVTKFNFLKLERIMEVFHSINLDLAKISMFYPQGLNEEQKNVLAEFFGGVARLSEIDMKDVTKLVTPVKFLTNGTSVFEPFKDVVKLMNLREALPRQYSEHDQSLMSKNLKQVMNMAKGLKSSGGDIKRLENLRSNTKELEMVDLKNIGDPWLGRMFKVRRASLDKLANSFKPLPLALEILNNFNNELKVVAGSSQMYDGFEQLSALLLSIPDGIEHVTAFMNKIYECNSPVDEKFESQFKTLMLNVGKVQDLFNVLVDLSSIENKFKKLKRKVMLLSPINLDKHLIRVKVEGILEELQQLTLSYYEKLLPFQPYRKYKKLLKKLINGRKEFADKVDNELSVIKCLQQLKQDSEHFQKVIQVIQKMRNLDKDSVQNIQGIPSVVSEFLKNLAKVREISDKMKENSNNKTFVMNALSFNKSDSIKSIVSSVQNVYGLLDLEAPINLLKNVDTIVLEEIDKAQDSANLKSQWGDHKADMESLEATMTSAKAFVSELEGCRAKTLLEYTDPLKNLSKIPDVKMNASEKSKVIEELIKQNSNDDLIAAKETLDKIAVMNLQFSSAQYPEASFKALQDVLLTF